MSIIDETYFIGKIDLPTDNVNRVNKLQTYIDDSEKEYLIKALGYELYKLFIAYVANPTPTVDRYDDILNGSDFTNITTNKLDNWNGLQNTELKSFLAYFSYYEFLDGENESASGDGVTSNEFENSIKVSPIQKQTRAFSLGKELYCKLYDFLKANEDTYPEWNYTSLGNVNVLNI